MCNHNVNDAYLNNMNNIVLTEDAHFHFIEKKNVLTLETHLCHVPTTFSSSELFCFVTS